MVIIPFLPPFNRLFRPRHLAIEKLNAFERFQTAFLNGFFAFAVDGFGVGVVELPLTVLHDATAAETGVDNGLGLKVFADFGG